MKFRQKKTFYIKNYKSTFAIGTNIKIKKKLTKTVYHIFPLAKTRNMIEMNMKFIIYFEIFSIMLNNVIV